jgi:hypothetical protein
VLLRYCQGKALLKAHALQALIKTSEQRPSATQLLRHPWLTAYTNPTPPQASIGPQTPCQTQEAAPSYNYCLKDVPLQDKLTGTDQPVHHPVSFCEAADNMLPSAHGVHTSTLGVPQGSPQGSWGRDHGWAGMDGDRDWAIQAWAEEPPAALWMSQEVRQQFVEQCRSSQRRSDLCGTEKYYTSYASFSTAWHLCKA